MEVLSKEVNLSWHLKDEKKPIMWRNSKTNHCCIYFLKCSFPNLRRQWSHIMYSKLRLVFPDMCQIALSVYLKLSHISLTLIYQLHSLLKTPARFSLLLYILSCSLWYDHSPVCSSQKTRFVLLLTAPNCLLSLPTMLKNYWALSTISPKYFISLSISIHSSYYWHILGLNHDQSLLIFQLRSLPLSNPSFSYWPEQRNPHKMQIWVCHCNAHTFSRKSWYTVGLMSRFVVTNACSCFCSYFSFGLNSPSPFIL